MNKKAFLAVSICLILGASYGSFATPPGGGGSNYQTVDATTAEAYMNNYKNNVTNKFAEYYSLDLNAVTNIINSGAAAVRMYAGLMGDGSKVGLMVPVDVNYTNITTGSQMAAMTAVWVCPPACDVTKSGATAVSMSTANAQAAANNYNNNGTYDTYNAFLIYPAALMALKNAGAIRFHVCNGINTATGGRCIIYRGVTASGSAGYMIEDAGNMCSRCGL